MPTSTQFREELQRILNIDNINITAADDTRWLAKMEEGVIVTIKIGRWRMKTRQTETDLGITFDNATEETAFHSLMRLGDKLLMPPEIIRQCESADSSIRKNLERHAFRTAFGWFVPATNFATWKENHDRLVADYNAVRDEIKTDWYALQDRVMTGHYSNACAAYKRSANGNFTYNGMTTFADHYVQTLANEVPALGIVTNSFVVEVDYSYIPLPSLLAADRAEAERIKAQRDLERKEESLRSDQLWLRLSMEDAMLEQRKRQLEEMNRTIVENARKQKEESITGFLANLTTQLRTLIYEATTDVLGTLQGKTSLHPRSATQLRNLVESVGRLNFFGDTESARMIQSIQDTLDAYKVADKGVKPIGQLQDQLKAIATVTRASLIALGETPRSNVAIGIADIPEITAVRQARTAIKLDQPITPISTIERQSRT